MGKAWKLRNVFEIGGYSDKTVKVGTEGRVIIANEVYYMFHVVEDPVSCAKDAFFLYEHRLEDDADTSAGGGNGPDLLIADVAPHVASCADTSVRKDKGFGCGGSDINDRVKVDMGAVYDHAESVHLVDDIFTEFGKAAGSSFIGGTGGDLVRSEVGESHVPLSGVEEALNVFDFPTERMATFNAEE